MRGQIFLRHTSHAVIHSAQSRSMSLMRYLSTGVPPSSSGGAQLSFTCSARI